MRWQPPARGWHPGTGHMLEPAALVVSFVLGRDFHVAEIQALLWQALTRALCAKGEGLATPDPVVAATQALLRQALTRALHAYPSLLALYDAEQSRPDRVRYGSTAVTNAAPAPVRLQHQLSLVRHLLSWSSTSLRLLLALTAPVTTMTRTN